MIGATERPTPIVGHFAFAIFAKSFAYFAVKRESQAKPQRSLSLTQGFAEKGLPISKLTHHQPHAGLDVFPKLALVDCEMVFY